MANKTLSPEMKNLSLTMTSNLAYMSATFPFLSTMGNAETPLSAKMFSASMTDVSGCIWKAKLKKLMWKTNET